MKTIRHPIFLPIFALIAFLGLGAGTVMADNSSQGVGVGNSEDSDLTPVVRHLSDSSFLFEGTSNAGFTQDATGSGHKRKAFVGTLDLGGISTEVTGTAVATFDSFVLNLQTGDGSEETVAISMPVDAAVSINEDGLQDHPQIRTPGGKNRQGTFAPGARVVVLAELTGRETWEAVWILIKPSKPNAPFQGVVVAAEGDEITIETPDGETETVTVDEEEGDVEPGEVVTVFRGNSNHATGLVRAEEVKNRLERFLDDAEDDVDEAEASDEGDEEKGKKLDKAAKHFDRISGFLNRFSDRQENLLDRVIGGAPEDVKARLQDVKERIATRRLEHRQRIENLQNRLDRIHPSHSGQGRPDAADGPGHGRPDSAGEQSEQSRPSDFDGGKPEGAGQRPEKADKAQDGDRPASPSSDKGKRGKNLTGDASGDTEEGEGEEEDVVEEEPESSDPS